jgi:hypothetical protein
MLRHPIRLALLSVLGAMTLGSALSAQQRVLTQSTLEASSVYATDLDGDGDADVLAGCGAGELVVWYENQGGGAFGVTQVIHDDTPAIGTPGDTTSVYATDLDGDGDADVLSASTYSGKIAWYENLGGGDFGAQQVITTNFGLLTSVSAIDLDGDGDADVLSASYSDDKIAWYENQGGGVFGAQQVITTSADGAVSVYATDLDGDGDADVLSASRFDNKIAWYENQGGGAFGAQQVITTSADVARSVYATDLDGDGDADVLSASAGDDEIAWYENQGGGVFGTQQVITTSADGAWSVHATDLDGDGSPEVLSASSADNKIAWYEGLILDCNGNGVADNLDITNGTSPDCNGNGIPDECDLASGRSRDCNANGTPDGCEIAAGSALDCNANGVPDACDISNGSESDVNGNGVPDSCEPIIGTRYCTASANSSGLPGELTIIGSNLISQNDVTLTAEQLPLQSFGYFITSRTLASIHPVPGSQGTLCVTGSIGRFVGPGQIVDSGSTGAVALSIDLSALPTPTGLVSAGTFSTWYFQLWHRDANPTLTSNFTDAVAVTFF